MYSNIAPQFSHRRIIIAILMIDHLSKPTTVHSEYIFDRLTIKTIWNILQYPVRVPNLHHATNIARRSVEAGWMFRHDLEDLLIYMDDRFASYGFKLVPIGKSLGIHWERIGYRPTKKSHGPMDFDATRCEEAALLVILFERMGFQVDASILVDLLLPKVQDKSKKLLSGAELQIIWYHETNGKTAPLALRVEDYNVEDVVKTIITPSKYKVSISGASEESPDMIEFKSPRYRRNPLYGREMCPECGVEWRRGDPDSSYQHRKAHKEIMHFLDPKPLSEMANEIKNSVAPEVVNIQSSIWKHKEIYGRARAFKTEMGFDRVQWLLPKRFNDPFREGYLFTNDEGVIIGACSFVREKNEQRIYWVLDWVWVVPSERRKGHLHKRWKSFREKFGDFKISFPVSAEMQSFVRKQGDGRLLDG